MSWEKVLDGRVNRQWGMIKVKHEKFIEELALQCGVKSDVLVKCLVNGEMSVEVKEYLGGKIIDKLSKD